MDLFLGWGGGGAKSLERSSGSLVAHQSSGAGVPGSNPASPDARR